MIQEHTKQHVFVNVILLAIAINFEISTILNIALFITVVVMYGRSLGSARGAGWRIYGSVKNVAGVDFRGLRPGKLWPRRLRWGVGERCDGLRGRGVWRNSGGRFSARGGRWSL